MTTKFVIFSAPRSGSTLLARTLGHIDNIECHGEILAPGRVLGFRDGFDAARADQDEIQQRRERLLLHRERDSADFVLAALDRRVSACGFKVIYHDMILTKWRCAFDALQSGGSTVFIHLIRQNSLRRFVSEKIMRNGGPIHSKVGGRSRVKISIRFDEHQYESRCKDIASEQEAALRILEGQQVVPVLYEDLVIDFDLAIKQLCGYLGVDTGIENITPALEKVGADDLEAVVENYGEMVEYATRIGKLDEIEG